VADSVYGFPTIFNFWLISKCEKKKGGRGVPDRRREGIFGINEKDI